jgi:ribonuclease E
MSKKMLIDATHQEETRVVIVQNNKIQDLDVETSIKKQIKGNIYLAKVIRVEPSLQAAFVDYGGNRHGFLAFNEIHPDYYQIPVADREALKKEIKDREKEQEEKKEESSSLPEEKKPEVRKRGRKKKVQPLEQEEPDSVSEPVVDEASEEQKIKEANKKESESSACADSDNELEDFRKIHAIHLKKYKIQEVIHHNQILLVQVVKEERGNKGAALTTYLSLAGRYCVLMPNNSRGGGVSRKIVNLKDRRRLKEIVENLPLPEDMSVIVRTAGKEKTKAEIKRDFDFLMKTWSQVRDKTLNSLAPSLIHEEGNIIKRCLRDDYNQDIEEILVDGEEGYKTAKDFFKLLIPSHARKIKQYKGIIPLFQEYQVEEQLENLHNPVAQLKSGGYLVINQTEALVAIDVNSGRATKERDIEETALKTNLEACDEVARQLKLRDLAGLVVIDFIDMDEARNNHAVERRMKEVLKDDRARVQMGLITGFGLMELSRQRLRSSFLETNHIVCPYCNGQGIVRSVESCALQKLRLLEESARKATGREMILTLQPQVALYLLNHKRSELANLEKNYDLTITIQSDTGLFQPTEYRLESFVKGKSQQAVSVVKENSNPTLQEFKEDRKNKKNGGKKKNKNRSEQKNEQQDTPPQGKKTGNKAETMKDAVQIAAVSADSEEQEKTPVAGSSGGKNNHRRKFRKNRSKGFTPKPDSEMPENQTQELVTPQPVPEEPTTETDNNVNVAPVAEEQKKSSGKKKSDTKESTQKSDGKTSGEKRKKQGNRSPRAAKKRENKELEVETSKEASFPERQDLNEPTFKVVSQTSLSEFEEELHTQTEKKPATKKKGWWQKIIS